MTMHKRVYNKAFMTSVCLETTKVHLNCRRNINWYKLVKGSVQIPLLYASLYVNKRQLNYYRQLLLQLLWFWTPFSSQSKKWRHITHASSSVTQRTLSAETLAQLRLSTQLLLSLESTPKPSKKPNICVDMMTSTAFSSRDIMWSTLTKNPTTTEGVFRTVGTTYSAQ